MQPFTTLEQKAILAKFLDDKAAQKPAIQTRYLQYYENVLEDVATGSFGVAVGMPVHSDHAEMRSLFDELVSNPKQTKKKLRDVLATTSSELEKDNAIRAMLRVALMVDCGSKEDYPEGYKVRDFVPSSWSDDQSFCTYVEAVFPPPKLSPVARERVHQVISQRSRLKAWKLKSRYKIHLRPTNNLAEHLVFEKDGRVLKVFGQVNFLKAHLRQTRSDAIDLSFEKSLERGTLPPQLLLEVIDSMQFLLFPNDKKSVKSLDEFIKKHGFDSDAKYREGRIREFPADFEYKYFGNRVAALLDIVNKPPPANRIVAWFERHTSERNALTVAILGLFLTALFGFLTTVTGFVAMVYSIKQYKVALKALPPGPQ